MLIFIKFLFSSSIHLDILVVVDVFYDEMDHWL